MSPALFRARKRMRRTWSARLVVEALPRILVVDDDVTVSEVVARYLERDGYVVEVQANGRVALDRALAEPPDLIVLDLMLPGMDGLEVCRRLRAIAPVPIVMLTAGPRRATASSASTSGPTTTSPSRSRPRSWSPGCGRCSAGRRDPLPADGPGAGRPTSTATSWWTWPP